MAALLRNYALYITSVASILNKKMNIIAGSLFNRGVVPMTSIHASGKKPAYFVIRS